MSHLFIGPKRIKKNKLKLKQFYYKILNFYLFHPIDIKLVRF
jgi:hypothetical protein